MVILILQFYYAIFINKGRNIFSEKKITGYVQKHQCLQESPEIKSNFFHFAFNFTIFLSFIVF